MTATVQGWTLSMYDDQRNSILSGVFTQNVKVEYDSDRFEYGMNRNDRFQTSNFYRHGTITAEFLLSERESQTWNQYVQRLFSDREPRLHKSNLTIQAGGNSAHFNDAVLVSLNWGMNFSEDEEPTTEVSWKFSGVRDVVSLPPRELRKVVKLQNLDWRIYGF